MYLTTVLKVRHRIGDGRAVSVPAVTLMVMWPAGSWLAATTPNRKMTRSPVSIPLA